MKYYKQLSTMKNFHGLVKLMVEHIPCPGIIQLKHITDVPELVAQLAYNHSLRFQQFVLGTSDDMISMMREDIIASMSCVEFLCRRLRLMDEGSRLHASWAFAKEVSKRFMEKPKSVMLYGMTRDAVNEVQGWIISEVATKVSKSLSYLCMHCHTVSLLSVVMLSGEMPKLGTFHLFLEVAKKVPESWFGPRYRKLLAKVKRALVTGLRRSLDLEELREVYRTMVWLSRNFIYQFLPKAVKYEPDCPDDLAEAPPCEDLGKEDDIITAASAVFPKTGIPDGLPKRALTAPISIANINSILDLGTLDFAKLCRNEYSACKTQNDVKLVQNRLRYFSRYLIATYERLQREENELKEEMQKYRDRAAPVPPSLERKTKFKKEDINMTNTYMDCVEKLELEGVIRDAEIMGAKDDCGSAGKLVEAFFVTLEKDPARAVATIVKVFENWSS
jgi:hypothetical protein